MLDTETIKNISTFVEITMQVEERLRGKYDFEVERINKELAIAVEDRDKIAAHARGLINKNDELEEQVKDLEAQIEELAGQKERQAATVRELMEARDRQAETIEELTDEKVRQAKQIADIRREIKAKQGPYPATDEELQKKLDKAMDHIRRQGEEIDKLRAGAADPRWVPLRDRRPDMGENVLACTKRGTIYIAQETDEGWKNTTGKMAEPVAWMPLPARYTGGEA